MYGVYYLREKEIATIRHKFCCCMMTAFIYAHDESVDGNEIVFFFKGVSTFFCEIK